MAAGFCVYVRLEKPVKEIELHIFVNWVREEAAGRAVRMPFKSFHRSNALEEFYGLCEPLGKCPQTRASGRNCVAEAQTHSTNVNCNHVANKLEKHWIWYQTDSKNSNWKSIKSCTIL